MRTPTGSLHSAAPLVCAVLVLTACSDDPQQPGSLPSGTPSATSSSAVPSPDTPEEQVEAAVRAYYAELTRAAQTQDTTRFKELVTSGCPCFNAAKAIEKAERRGLTTPSAAWRVASIAVHELENASAVAEVEYRVTAYEVINDAGDVVDRYEAQSGHVDLSLVRSDRGWIVGNLFDLEG